MKEYRVRQMRDGKLTFARTFGGGYFATAYSSVEQAERAIAMGLEQYDFRKSIGDKYIGERPEYIIQSRQVGEWA